MTDTHSHVVQIHPLIHRMIQIQSNKIYEHICEPQGYRLPVAAAWPFLGAPVGAGAPTLTPMALQMPLSVAQAATVPSAVHSAPTPTASPAATSIVLAPRHPAHSALPAAVTAQTAAPPTTRRRYIELNRRSHFFECMRQKKQNSKIEKTR